MLDHMLFNKLKWFNIADNSDQVNANGKRYVAFPPTVTVKEDYSFNGQTESWNSSKIKWTDSPFGMHIYKKGDKARCIGADGDYYVVDDLPDYNSSTGGVYKAIIKKDLFIENWGGKTSLIRLYQRFRSLFYPRREVA